MENLKPFYLFEIIVGTITDPCIFYIIYLKKKKSLNCTPLMLLASIYIAKNKFMAKEEIKI